MPSDANPGFITRYQSRAELQNTPSRRDGIDAEKELSFKRQTYQFIRKMSEQLKL